MNLFFTEALHLLLSIDIPGVSLTRRLVPATEFLHNHLVTLNETTLPAMLQSHSPEAMGFCS